MCKQNSWVTLPKFITLLSMSSKSEYVALRYWRKLLFSIEHYVPMHESSAITNLLFPRKSENESKIYRNFSDSPCVANPFKFIRQWPGINMLLYTPQQYLTKLFGCYHSTLIREEKTYISTNSMNETVKLLLKSYIDVQ